MTDGPVEKEKPQKTASQTETQPLAHSPFLEIARHDTENAVAKLVVASTKKEDLGQIGGASFFKTDFVGSLVQITYGHEDIWRALKKDEEFVVVKLPTKSKEDIASGLKNCNLALGPASSLGITAKLLDKISKEGYKPGELPRLEEVLKAFADKKLPAIEVYVARPIDCISLVNRSLKAAGAKELDVQKPGQDLKAALQKPGMATIWTRPTPVVSMDFGSLSISPSDTAATADTSAAALSDTTGTITAKAAVDSQAMKSFFMDADAKAGDVICFLERAKGVYILGDAIALEKRSDDRVLWLDAKNRLINTRGMDPKSVPGTAYKVGHTGVYTGLDAETNEPLVAQSHIYSGHIVNEKMAEYLSRNSGLWEGIAVISNNFFVKTPPMAMARNE